MTAEHLYLFIRLLLFAFLCGLILSYLFTRPVIWIGHTFGFMDEPNERRIHDTPTPRCGGLAVFAAFTLTLVVMFKLVGFEGLTQETRSWTTLILPLTLPVILLGLADDKWELSPFIKLFGQIVVALLAWYSGMRIGNLLGLTLFPALDCGITVLLYITAMNAYNLIDGMDGVAAGIAVITSLGLCGLNIVLGNEAMAAICLALTGSCLGFLRYNFHPARIFLGDTGSLYIGFLLMSLTLASQSRTTAAILFVVPLLTLGVPLIDTGLAIWRRSIRKAIRPNDGSSISGADKDHLHHRLARKGFTQRKVAITLYGLQAAFFALGLLWVVVQNYRIAIFTITFFVGSFVVLRYLASLEMTDSGKWIVDGIKRPGRAQLYRSFMPMLDIGMISISLVVLSWLLASDFSSLTLGKLIQQSAVSIIGCPVILIWACKYYRVQWTRARALEFFYTAALLVAGVVVGLAISPLAQQYDVRHSVLFTVVILGTALPLMIFLRVFPRLVQDLVHYYERKKAHSVEKPLPRVLIYGAGYGFTLITRSEQFTDLSQRKEYQLIGLIDDDPHLKGRAIHGHDVLGSIEDVEHLCAKHQIDEVLISATLAPEHRQKLMEIAELQDLKVSKSMFANEILRERLISELKEPSPLTP